MIAIVDYGVGNLFSLKSSFSSLGIDVVATSDQETIARSDKIVLPGVGAFADAAARLKECGMAELLLDMCRAGKPLLGICLGMQLLFDKSYEYGEHKGLGLIKGEIRPISEIIPADLKIPHIGWNELMIVKQNPIFKHISNGDYVYFVHSYHAIHCESSIIAKTEYGAPLTAAVAEKNVFGCQFHPEKSGEVGLKILKAFAEWKKEDVC